MEKSKDIRNQYRKIHASMEREKAISYSVMSGSNIFVRGYAKYVNFIKEILSTKKSEIKMLNIGSGSGHIEKVLLDNFSNKLKISSFDNSVTFLKIAKNTNSDYIISKKIKFKKLDILVDELKIDEFDIIFSRDLNHHLIDIPTYLEKCYKTLNYDGIMLMEDLRFNAKPEAIKDFINKIFEVDGFKNDRWLLYVKLLGLVESYSVSYSTEEISFFLKKTNFYYSYFKSKGRYHFVLYKNKKISETINKLISTLRERYSGEAIISRD